MSAHHSAMKRSIGFALVWANVPFARLITVIMKGGDEGVITRAISGQSKLSTLVWTIELIIILVLVLPAFVRAWKSLVVKRRPLIFISFLILPMLLEYVLMHKLGGNLLKQGILDQQGFLGSPVLVLLWNAFWLLLLLMTAKALSYILREEIVHHKEQTAHQVIL
jgi:hypothetical protein